MARVVYNASRSVRLSLPLIKTAALLITHAGFAGVPVPSSDSTAAADILSTAADSHSKQQAIAAAAAAAAEQKGYSSTAESNGTSSSFAWGVLQLLKQELRACADVPKLLEGAALMAQLACIPDCSASAIQSVMVLLVNRFPKVSAGRLDCGSLVCPAAGRLGRTPCLLCLCSR